MLTALAGGLLYYTIMWWCKLFFCTASYSILGVFFDTETYVGTWCVYGRVYGATRRDVGLCTEWTIAWIKAKVLVSSISWYWQATMVVSRPRGSTDTLRQSLWCQCSDCPPILTGCFNGVSAEILSQYSQAVIVVSMPRSSTCTPRLPWWCQCPEAPPCRCRGSQTKGELTGGRGRRKRHWPTPPPFCEPDRRKNIIFDWKTESMQSFALRFFWASEEASCNRKKRLWFHYHSNMLFLKYLNKFFVLSFRVTLYSFLKSDLMFTICLAAMKLLNLLPVTGPL